MALSFRLLRYINSAFFGLRFEISSIGQALALLGVDNLGRWATLTAGERRRQAAGADRHGAHSRALLRAFRRAAPGPRPGELFTLGLFSVIDALMDAPIEDVIALIPFPADMRDALMSTRRRQGRPARQRDSAGGGRLRSRPEIVRGAGDLYLEALMWTNGAAGALFEGARDAAKSPRCLGAAGL